MVVSLVSLCFSVVFCNSSRVARTKSLTVETSIQVGLVAFYLENMEDYLLQGLVQWPFQRNGL